MLQSKQWPEYLRGGAFYWFHAPSWAVCPYCRSCFPNDAETNHVGPALYDDRRSQQSTTTLARVT